MPSTAAFGDPSRLGAFRERAVERHRCGEPRLAGGEQLPRHPAAEAEPDDGERGVGGASLELVEPGAAGRRSVRSVGALPSAAVASPSLGMLAVPPSADSRSIASAV